MAMVCEGFLLEVRCRVSPEARLEPGFTPGPFGPSKPNSLPHCGRETGLGAYGPGIARGGLGTGGVSQWARQGRRVPPNGTAAETRGLSTGPAAQPWRRTPGAALAPDAPPKHAPHWADTRAVALEHGEARGRPPETVARRPVDPQWSRSGPQRNPRESAEASATFPASPHALLKLLGTLAGTVRACSTAQWTALAIGHLSLVGSEGS